MVAELDVFWSSDAFDDVTGAQSAALINQHGARVQMLHIKDGINITARGAGISSRGGSPRPTGTGELDFRPILAAAANRVRWYHMEQDGGSPHDGNISFTNLKGSGPTAVGTPLALPTSFPSVAAGTPATSNVVPVLVQNTGDAPLTITNATITGTDAVDFSIVTAGSELHGRTGRRTAGPGRLATDTTPAVPRGNASSTSASSPRGRTTTPCRPAAHLGGGNATETILLTGLTRARHSASIGGDVGGNVGCRAEPLRARHGQLRHVRPGRRPRLHAALAATVTSTAGDAALTVTDSERA